MKLACCQFEPLILENISKTAFEVLDGNLTISGFHVLVLSKNLAYCGNKDNQGNGQNDKLRCEEICGPLEQNFYIPVMGRSKKKR